MGCTQSIMKKMENKNSLWYNLEPMMLQGQIVFGVRMGESNVGLSQIGNGVMLIRK